MRRSGDVSGARFGGNLSHVANWRRNAALMLERSGKINASFGIFASLVKEMRV